MAEDEDLTLIEGTGAEDVADDTPPPTVHDYARAKGWKPQEEWDPSRGEWRDAQAFLDFTFDRNRDLSRDLKELKRTTETMAETQARIMREQADRIRQEERERLEAIHRQAVDDGDQAVAQEVVKKLAAQSAPQTGPDPAVDRFRQENTWFDTDPIARAVAIAAGEEALRRGASVADQLQAARDAVLQRFPEHGAAKSEPAKVIEVAQPSATASAPKRGKTFHDLPREAQEAARQMVAQGLLKNTDGYVRQYFNKEGTVE